MRHKEERGRDEEQKEIKSETKSEDGERRNREGMR
jgi:hypothetical protein